LGVRIEDLGSLADGPADYSDGRATRERLAFARAGRGLGRALVDVINVCNPGRVIVLLPASLASTGRDTAGSAYRVAMETVVDTAYSTGASDARARDDRLCVQALPEGELKRGQLGAVAAACCGLDAFLDHVRGTDICAGSNSGREAVDAA
jgi:hypothetical protein